MLAAQLPPLSTASIPVYSCRRRSGRKEGSRRAENREVGWTQQCEPPRWSSSQSSTLSSSLSLLLSSTVSSSQPVTSQSYIRSSQSPNHSLLERLVTLTRSSLQPGFCLVLLKMRPIKFYKYIWVQFKWAWSKWEGGSWPQQVACKVLLMSPNSMSLIGGFLFCLSILV